VLVILDYGSQYTQLIARRLRELGLYCEILPCTASVEEIRSRGPKGLILSGGPASVYGHKAPELDPHVEGLPVPLLGICYGMQLLAHASGGEVSRAAKREYGHAKITVTGKTKLFAGLPKSFTVWMSHGDSVHGISNGFRRVARTPTAPYAAIADEERQRYGIQFHPEVAHTPLGGKILENFGRKVCGIHEKWTAGDFIEQSVAELRAKIGEGKVLLALSGGVDSTVAAALLNKAIGARLHCVFVDHGLQRQGETERIRRVLIKDLGVNVRIVDAKKRFLSKLAGVTDPERKRKIIGREFIKVFEEEAAKDKGVEFLGQGTLYPDVIESVSVRGPSAVIKSHHNVGGLPKNMKLKLVEPFRYLFKDEVRRVGLALGLPRETIDRHPFPGPALSIRILGAVDEDRLRKVREADAIVEQEARAAGLYEKLWQAFAVLLPVRTVGVMGDERTYENVIAVRVVESKDGMTADWARLPHELLAKISSRIVSEVRGVNRVVYDVSSKPPSTIEWE
jgi:GMP synthase (glutamine-hydrolysing)